MKIFSHGNMEGINYRHKFRIDTFAYLTIDHQGFSFILLIFALQPVIDEARKTPEVRAICFNK